MIRFQVFPALLGFISLTAPATAAEVPVNVAQRPDLKAVFGQVESRDVVPARARIGGTVTSLSVEEGTAVKAGDVIARVVDDKLALQLNAVDARIKAVSERLGVSFGSYAAHEAFYLGVARLAGINGWELDRLLYNFRSEVESRL